MFMGSLLGIVKMQTEIRHQSGLVLISGATASGKSDYAEALASRYNGEIINFDVGQFYNCTPSIVAMPTFEMGRKSYHLYGIFGPAEVLMAPRICELVTARIKEVNSRSKLAILVGCSGMYISALLDGLSVLPSTDAKFRQSIAAVPTYELYSRLEELTPLRASTIESNDRVRIERLLEVIHIVGVDKLEGMYNQRIKYDLPEHQILCITRAREDLYARINERVAGWFREDIYYREVIQLLERHSMDVEVFKILGLKEIKQFGDDFDVVYNQHRDSLQEAIKQNTRRYAKRQLTFWRNQPLKSGWHVDYVEL